MNASSDIIAAIATGAGRAAVGIVRLSGPGSHALALRLCPGLRRTPADRRMTRCRVVHPTDGRALDDALVVFFREGASFTGEEAVEIHGHGGPAVLDGLLHSCLDAGARPARAGEFTRRALAAGRLDLAQAEAVALLAEAAGDGAVALALETLSGRPSAEVSRLEGRLLDGVAELEASLDFAEEDGVRVDLAAVAGALAAVGREMDAWLEAARAARAAIAGWRVALVGPPNAGKSSLFNALIGRGRAIVHAEPGTTRDVVSEDLPLAGATCVLLDTAGLRTTDGEVEAEGVRRARDAAEQADCVILIVDGAAPGAADQVVELRATGVRPAVLVVAKADLWGPGTDRPAPGIAARDGEVVLTVSTRTGLGVDALRALLSARAAEATSRGRVARCVVAGERQVEALDAARRMVAEGLAGLADSAPVEVVAGRMRAAAERLAETTGRRVSDEVLDRVFARFCVGK